MCPNAPYDEPSHVEAEAGEILMNGPNGLAAAFTPDAAEETGRRLVRAAREARQRHGRR